MQKLAITFTWGEEMECHCGICIKSNDAKATQWRSSGLAMGFALILVTHCENPAVFCFVLFVVVLFFLQDFLFCFFTKEEN